MKKADRRAYRAELVRKRKQLDRKNEILKDPSVTHLYITKHGLYFRPNCSGYTDNCVNAGIYPKEKYAGWLMDDACVVVPIDNDRHNRLISESIESMKSRIIDT